jgi:hypothetical protein
LNDGVLLGNEFCTLFSQEVKKYRRKEASLEAGRDVIRRELGKVNRLLRFGEYTSIEQVCQTIPVSLSPQVPVSSGEFNFH